MDTTKNNSVDIVNNLMISLQTSVNSINEKKAEFDKTAAVNNFLSALRNIPLEYKSMDLHFQFDSNTEGLEKYQEALYILLKLSPLDKKGYEYKINILIPRKPSFASITSKHGSPVREQVFKQGIIETIVLNDFRYDNKTADNNTLEINPVRLGALSINQRLGKYRLFPRQIKHISLATEYPNYLNELDIDFVENFYNIATAEVESNPVTP